ncbi:MAG TPA: GntR family transcriptional regulator [Prolixibacteraceae bacterium]|nr:GntR family transcriptional regulator [Prolixibacteraceae bacterium]
MEYFFYFWTFNLDIEKILNNLPLHKRIYEQLRKHISEGIYKEGDLLPSENDLCNLHGVTRPTIRKALDRLTAEGFIIRQQGKGSIVKGAPKGIGILSLLGTTSAVGNEKLITRIVTKPEIRPWDKAFSFEISDLEKELGCIFFERLRLINNKPVFFDTTMIPNINLPRFSQRNFENQSLFNMLRENYQIEVSGGEQKIQATLADENMQQFFQIPIGSPILQLDRKIATNKPDFFFYSQVLCNSREYSLVGTF